jgi:phosphoglycerate kinase
MGAEEEKNDESFAKSLASLGEIYVNDAFAAYRPHASVVGIPKFLPSYVGLYYAKEVEELSKVFKPEHPFLFILGGAKLDTKLPLLEKFLKLADSIFVGGVLADEALKNGMEIIKDSKIIIPKGDLKARDINEETLNLIKEKAQESKFILWNGPVGYYEEGHDWGTKEIAKCLAKACENGTTVIVGGGDTLAAIKELNLQNKFTHISLAGGAMLEFLANGTLPGIEALQN